MDFFTIIIIVVIVFVGIMLWSFFAKPKSKPQLDSIYTEALNALIRGEQNVAVDLLRQVVKQDSNHVNAYLQLGNILRNDHTDQAIKIHQSLTVRPNLSKQMNIEIHQSLALDFEKAGRLEKAKQEAEQILNNERRNRWAIEFLLKAAVEERNWTEAMRLAKMIQRIEGAQDVTQLARYQVYQGLDYLSNEDRKNARVSFNKAVKTDPDFGLPFLHLGNLAEAERDLGKAIDFWEKFAFRDPEENIRVFHKVETALYDMGRFSEIEKFYRRILKRFPDNLDALAKLAGVLEEKGEHHEALNLVERALGRHADSIQLQLMKLKFSVSSQQPHELARQIDGIISNLPAKDPD
jgi:lipopolysaccharide biosynthesis regulator YciM